MKNILIREVSKIIDKLSNRLATAIVSAGAGDRDKYDWYAYQTGRRIGQLLTYGTIAAVALLSGQVVQTCIFLFFMISLRTAAGGYHANSRIICYVTSIGVYLVGVFVLPVPYVKHPFLAVAALAISAVLVILYAPIIHPNLYQTSGHREKLRRVSRILLLVQVLAITIAANCGVDATYLYVACSGMFTSSILLLVAKIIKQEGHVHEDS